MKKVESTLKIAIKKGQNLGQISTNHEAKLLARFSFNNISGLKVAVKSNKNKKELIEVINLCVSVLRSV